MTDRWFVWLPFSLWLNLSVLFAWDGFSNWLVFWAIVGLTPAIDGMIQRPVPWLSGFAESAMLSLVCHRIISQTLPDSVEYCHLAITRHLAPPLAFLQSEELNSCFRERCTEEKWYCVITCINETKQTTMRTVNIPMQKFRLCLPTSAIAYLFSDEHSQPT